MSVPKSVPKRFRKDYYMNVYVYCDGTKRNKDGNIPVSIAVKNKNGRFFVNTGLTTSEKFTGREFPKSEKNRIAKNGALNRYIAKIEEICLNYTDLDNKKLKERINADVFCKNSNTGKKLVDYIHAYIDSVASFGTKEVYARTERHVSMFDKSASLESVDREWLENYRKHYSTSLKVNTIAIDLRNIRAVFNRAIDDEVTKNYPFRKFKIGSERVAIRNLTAEQIAMFRDCEVEPWLEIYRDLFMLDFYLCGVNAADLLLCKSLTNGRFVGNRKKTGAPIDLPVEPEALNIIKKYKGKDWLLSPMDGRTDHRSFEHIWNNNLKKIGRVEKVKDKVGKMRKIIYHPLFGNDFQMTTYVARYSFASIASSIGIDRETIALCLSHSWADVTDHYINYDRKRVDEAVRKVIDHVNSFTF